MQLSESRKNARSNSKGRKFNSKRKLRDKSAKHRRRVKGNFVNWRSSALPS